jgi:hypothetical protein
MEKPVDEVRSQVRVYPRMVCQDARQHLGGLNFAKISEVLKAIVLNELLLVGPQESVGQVRTVVRPVVCDGVLVKDGV